MIAPYRELYSEIYPPSLSGRQMNVSEWRRVIPSDLTPRAARAIERYRDYVIYSDAASTHARIAAIFPRRGAFCDPCIELLAKDQNPIFRQKMFRKTNPIYVLDLLALLAFISMLRNRLRNSPVGDYRDNNNRLFALIRGDRNTAVIVDMSATSWRVLQRYGVDIFLGGVSSMLNIADHAARAERSLPYEVEERVHFRELFRFGPNGQKAHPHLPDDV